MKGRVSIPALGYSGNALIFFLFNIGLALDLLYATFIILRYILLSLDSQKFYSEEQILYFAKSLFCI